MTNIKCGGVENILRKGKMLVTSIFSFDHTVFIGHYLQGCQNLGLFDTGLSILSCTRQS